MPKNFLTNLPLSIFLMSLTAPVLSADTKLNQGTDNMRQASSKSGTALPADIEAIMNKPMYKNAKWGLRVINRETGQELFDLNSDTQFFIGSVRKTFSVGELLNKVGPKYQSVTIVHKDSVVKDGSLKGNLVLVASGDLTMGGRTLPDGKVAYTSFDHNEADSLGNAILTKPNPLAGYQHLAKQIKQSGINEIVGDVIIDDRLFEDFNFRGQFDVSPIFVNDDVVDVIINPGKVKDKANVSWRPKSAAFNVVNELFTTDPSQKNTLKLDPILPACIGKPDCFGTIQGNLPINFPPP